MVSSLCFFVINGKLTLLSVKKCYTRRRIYPFTRILIVFPNQVAPACFTGITDVALGVAFRRMATIIYKILQPRIKTLEIPWISTILIDTNLSTNLRSLLTKISCTKLTMITKSLLSENLSDDMWLVKRYDSRARACHT